MPGATVDSIGVPYENFVLQAMALRLECLRLGSVAAGGSFSAAQFLPSAIGVLQRAPLIAGSGLAARLPVDSQIAVALPTADAGAFLARLCTQTAALLLPSTVFMILAPGSPQSVSLPRYFEPLAGSPPPDLANARFAFDAVEVASAADCPATFPVVVLNPSLQAGGLPLGQLLRQSLVAALADAARSMTAFDAAGFVAGALAAHGIDTGTFVERTATALDKVVALVERAIAMRRAIFFKPTNPTNPLCDVCAVIPCAPPLCAVFMLWFEVRDRRKAGFNEKLDMALNAEFLLGPAAERLAHAGVSIAGTVFVPVARAPFNVTATP